MNPIASTISGWAFGTANAIPVAPTPGPPALLPRRQIPLIGSTFLPHDPIRPRELFPVTSGIRLSSASRLHAVADPNAPPPPVVATAVAAVAAPPAAMAPPAAPAADPPSSDVEMTLAEPEQQLPADAASIFAALQSRIEFLEQQANRPAAGGSNLPQFLVPSVMSGPGSGYLGDNPDRVGPLPSNILSFRDRRAVAPLPKPQPLSVAVLKSSRTDPEHLSLLVDMIFDYILRMGLNYPADVILYTPDTEVAKWVRSYFENLRRDVDYLPAPHGLAEGEALCCCGSCQLPNLVL